MCRKTLLTILLSTIIICFNCYGEDIGIRAVYNPRTGDTTLDTTLGKINLRTHGKTLDEFMANISATYNIPVKRIDLLINAGKLTPADIYMAAGISQILKCPFDTIINEYNKNKGKGWGVVTKRLGIKPGSKEFHELKKGSRHHISDLKKGNKNVSNDKSKNPAQEIRTDQNNC